MSVISPHYRTIKDLLQSRSFAIDEYQREYKWEAKNLQDLLNDLQGKFSADYQPGHDTKEVADYGEYFLGSIIVSQRGGKNYLVDGQQRVTSLTLLLIYLYRAAKAKQLSVIQTMAPLIFSDDMGEERFNLDISERLEVIKALYDGLHFSPEGKDESVQTMYARYQDIEASELVEDLGDGLAHFIYWLLNKVGLIEIATSNDDYANVIFESMNDRGKPLSPTDMLKAYLLAPITDPAERAKTNQSWKSQVLALISWNQEHDAERDAEFMKAWLRAQHAESIRERKPGATDKDWELIGNVFHRWTRDNHKHLGLGKAEPNRRFITERFAFFAKAWLQIQDASRQFTPGLEAIYYNAHNDLTLQSTVLLAPLLETDDYAMHQPLFTDEKEFEAMRDNVAALLLLPQDVNRSLQDKPYAYKRNVYEQQNFYAASLSDAIYAHQPQFKGYREGSSLPFESYANFTKAEHGKRSKLLLALVERIWSPERLKQVAALG